MDGDLRRLLRRHDRDGLSDRQRWSLGRRGDDEHNLGRDDIERHDLRRRRDGRRLRHRQSRLEGGELRPPPVELLELGRQRLTLARNPLLTILKELFAHSEMIGGSLDGLGLFGPRNRQAQPHGTRSHDEPGQHPAETAGRSVADGGSCHEGGEHREQRA